MRAPLWPAATCAALAVACALPGSARPASSCQPGAACVIASPSAHDPGRPIQFQNRPGRVFLQAGQHQVISFTNKGCQQTSTPIQVWAVYFSPTAGDAGILLGTIAPTPPGQTNSISFVVPPAPGAGFKNTMEQLSMSFSSPAMNCAAPGLTGTWTLGASSGCSVTPRVAATGRAVRGGREVDVTVIARGLSARCGRARLSWNSPFGTGRFNTLSRSPSGTTLMGRARRSGALSCFTKLRGSVRQGAFSHSTEASVRDGVPILTATATRDRAGVVQVLARVNHLRPKSVCGSADLGVVGSATRGPVRFSKLRLTGPTAAVGTARMTGHDACSTISHVVVRQRKIETGEIVRVLGDPPMCSG